MSGRPVQFLTAAALAVAASFVSVSAASATCYTGCGVSYAAPVAVYAAPVVYSYSYAAPVAYAPSCNCAYAAPSPMYVVNQGPSFTEPVTVAADPTPAYEGGYRRAYPYYGAGYRRAAPYYAGGGVRWHRHHWKHRVGHDGYRARFGYRHHGVRHGAAFHGRRFAMRQPMVGPGGIHRKHWHGAVGPRAVHRPMHHGMHRMHMHAPRHAGGGMKPGAVHPMGGPGGPKKKLP
jgi:hypothetical protein